MRELEQVKKIEETAGQTSVDDGSGPTVHGNKRKRLGIVDYNVQAAVDVKHHLIVAHEVTNVGNDHGQLGRMVTSAKNAMGKPKLKVVADGGAPVTTRCGHEI